MGSFETLEIAATANFHCDRKLVAVQRLSILAWLWTFVRIPRVLLRILRVDIDQLDDEIAVSAGGGGEEIRD